MDNRIIKTHIEEVAGQNFLDYALAVDKERAIVQGLDNLKPVGLRILYEMGKKTKLVKSAKIVGSVMGNYHPHGDSSIYDALIRMSQEWKARYPLIKVQGNKGTIEGDSPAAMRYTEAVLSPLGIEMINELKTKAFPTQPNYDNTTTEPIYAPSKFPNILANGSFGIGVGMSSQIVPHNLTDVINVLNYAIDNKDATVDELIDIIKGPDFPTGGDIINPQDLRETYRTGKGTIKLRAGYEVETVNGFPIITFNEIPYLTSLEKLKENIVRLKQEGDLEDVIDILRSDSIGREVNFQLKLSKKANITKTLNILFNKCSFQKNIYVKQLVLVNEVPTLLNLKGLVDNYLSHRNNAILLMTNKELKNIQEKLHLILGLIIVLSDIDKAVQIIKSSNDKSDAKNALILEFKIDELQANSVLDTRLHKLTSMEINSLINEKNGLETKIKNLLEILNNQNKRNEIIKSDINSFKPYCDERRTRFSQIKDEDEEIEIHKIVGVNHSQVLIQEASEIAPSEFKHKTKRSAMTTNKLYSLRSNSILGFTQAGKSFLKALDEVGEINDIIELYDFSAVQDKKYFITVTEKGLIKKTLMNTVQRWDNLLCTKLKENDKLKYVFFGNDEDFIFIIAEDKILKFQVQDIRTTSRLTFGTSFVKKEKVIKSATLVAKNQVLLGYSNVNQKIKSYNLNDFSHSPRLGTGHQTDLSLIYGINPKSTFYYLSDNFIYHQNKPIADRAVKTYKTIQNIVI